MTRREFYFDNAAATEIHPKALRAMIKAARETGNPSAFNDAGRRARTMLSAARADVAKFLSARTDEILFCASGSEANNLAVTGVCAATPFRARVVTTAIEHPSILETIRGRKIKATLIKPDDQGVVSVDHIRAAITEKTALVSVMYANNEIGSIQPIVKIAKAVKEYRRLKRTAYPYLHVDACQAAAWLPMNVQALGIDLLTLNGSKVHGPRGIAALYVRRGVKLRPMILGGGQEFGSRAGTENVPGVVGFAQALRLVRSVDHGKVVSLRKMLCEKLRQAVPDLHFNSPLHARCLPNIINASIPGTSSEELLLALDRVGIRAGAGSACTAHHVQPSHVLVAIGTAEKLLSGALRFSLSRNTKRQDIDHLVGVLPRVIASVRARRSSR